MNLSRLQNRPTLTFVSNENKLNYFAQLERLYCVGFDLSPRIRISKCPTIFCLPDLFKRLKDKHINNIHTANKNCKKKQYTNKQRKLWRYKW